MKHAIETIAKEDGGDLYRIVIDSEDGLYEVEKYAEPGEWVPEEDGYEDLEEAEKYAKQQLGVL